jgi:hypothetical protein
MDENPDKTASMIPAMSQSTLLQLQEQTTRKIESILAIMMPRPASADALKIVVTDYLDEPTVAAKELTVLDQSLAFLESSWQTLALLALAFVALMVMRSALYSSRAPESNDFYDRSEREYTDEDESLSMRSSRRDLNDDDEDWAPLPAARSTATTNATKSENTDKPTDDLGSLVKETPQVSTLLRDWISEAA